MSDQEFTPDKEWATGMSVFISKINDKPINIPEQIGVYFRFQISKDPMDVDNTIIRMKAHSKGNHLEFVTNLARFEEAIKQAKLRK